MTLGWPWCIYGKVNIGRLCIWMGKIVQMEFEGQNLQEMGKWTEVLRFWKEFGPQGGGGVCPCPGAFYMYTYITIIFKDLFLYNRLANQSQIL